MNQKTKRSSSHQKISEMILKVAEGYIGMGDSVEERGNYLRSACSAWNIACLPHMERERELKRYIDQYRKINHADETDCKNLEEDMRLLIKQKDRLFPDIKVQIVASKIKKINGKDFVTVASAKIN